MNAQVRVFDSGATRDLDQDKFDFEAFLSPLALERYAAYMHKNRKLPDGTLRDGDNWQRGIPLHVYMKSSWRHYFDWWKEHRGYSTNDGIEDALCALIFNAIGYLHEFLKAKNAAGPEIDHRAVAPNSPDAAVIELLPPGSAPGED